MRFLRTPPTSMTLELRTTQSGLGMNGALVCRRIGRKRQIAWQIHKIKHNSEGPSRTEHNA